MDFETCFIAQRWECGIETREKRISFDDVYWQSSNKIDSYRNKQRRDTLLAAVELAWPLKCRRRWGDWWLSKLKWKLTAQNSTIVQKCCVYVSRRTLIEQSNRSSFLWFQWKSHVLDTLLLIHTEHRKIISLMLNGSSCFLRFIVCLWPWTCSHSMIFDYICCWTGCT